METNNLIQNGLATTAEVMAYLRVSRTTLWRLCRTGALQPVRIGRALRYRWAELRQLAGEGSVK